MPSIKTGMDYAGCARFIGNKATRTISANTKIKKEDDKFIIELHGNAIVGLLPDGTVLLSTCGYSTMTTKARLNEYLKATHPQYGISQENFDWFIVDIRRGANFKVKMIETARINPNGLVIVDEAIDPLSSSR